MSIEYCRNVNTSPSFTGTDSEPVALFCCVIKVYTSLMPYCGGSYTHPSVVWYDQVKSIVSTSAGIVASIFTQLAPEHPPWSGPWRMMVSSITSTEPDVEQDWLYVHSPNVSALAGLANKAKQIAGIIISQRVFLPTPALPHPSNKHLLVFVLVPAIRYCYLMSMMGMVSVQQIGL